MIKTEIITDADTFSNYLTSLEGIPSTFDTETIGLSFEAPIIGTCHWDFNEKHAPVFASSDTLFEEGIPQHQFEAVLRDHMANLKVVCHNGKYDLGVIKRRNIPDPYLIADTACMIHLHNPDLLKKLETSVYRDLGIEKKTYEQVIGKKWPKTTDGWFDYVREGVITLDNMGQYGGEDAHDTGLLYNHYDNLLDDDAKLLNRRIENPLIFTLRDMYHEGININMPYLMALDEQLDKGLRQLEQDIYEQCGAVFNMNSGKQKAAILYDKLKMPCYKKTKGGDRSTDSNVLEMLAAEGYEVAQVMVEYSQLQKLSSGYTKSIPSMVDSDGRLRCSFNQDATRTGRFSSNNPNLQNQPNNSTYAIRRIYVPTDGWNLIVADLSQIELRIMAHVSGDPNFSKAFHNGEDIHGRVATDLGIKRKQAKVVNFGILYGMGPEKLAQGIGSSVAEAKRVIAGYEGTYYGYSAWKRKTEQFARNNGYIKNIFGRVRKLPEARNDSNKGLYFGALRKAVNTVVQGSAADYIKIAMNNVAEEYKKRRLRSRLLLTVHDELVVDSPPNETEQAARILVNHMETSVKLSVPVIADCKVVTNWHDMKDDDVKSILYKFQNSYSPWLYN